MKYLSDFTTRLFKNRIISKVKINQVIFEDLNLSDEVKNRHIVRNMFDSVFDLIYKEGMYRMRKREDINIVDHEITTFVLDYNSLADVLEIYRDLDDRDKLNVISVLRIQANESTLLNE